MQPTPTSPREDHSTILRDVYEVLMLEKVVYATIVYTPGRGNLELANPKFETKLKQSHKISVCISVNSNVTLTCKRMMC